MNSIELKGSVGIGGVNNTDDVKSIQNALNALLDLIPPTKKLPVDGLLQPNPEDSATVAAIKLFQSKVVGMKTPDGTVDPGQGTLNKINEELNPSEHPNESLNFSQQGLDFLKSLEQFKSKPYDDQTGKDIDHYVPGATIGYGHLIPKEDWDKYKNTQLTEKEGEELLSEDLKPYVTLIRDTIHVPQNQHQFDALIIFSFNIGPTNFKTSSVVKLINDPKAETPYSTLEEAWKAWTKSQGKVNQGLINRRNSEWNIYTKGVYKKES